MKQLNTLILIAFAVGLAGCVQSHYSKSISVKKDSNGQVLEIVETETVVQPGTGWPIKLEHLKGIQSTEPSKAANERH